MWLFSSGPLGTEVQDEEEQPAGLAKLAERIRPRAHVTFHGRLERSDRGFAERLLTKALRAPTGDFRDRDAIRGWADEIAAAVIEQRATTASARP